MKIFSLIIIIMTLVTFICGCSDDGLLDNEQPLDLNSTQLELDLSYEEKYSLCENVFIAQYTGERRLINPQVEMIFKPILQIKGDGVTGERVYIVEIGSATVDKDWTVIDIDTPHYIEGGLYVFYTSPRCNPYSEYTTYSPIMVDQLPITDYSEKDFINSGITEDLKPLEDFKSDNFLVTNLVKRLMKEAQTIPNSPINNYIQEHYIRSTDLSDIVSGSPVIIKVTVGESISQSKFDNATVNHCTINEVLKSTVSSATTSIRFSIGSVEVGKQYIVMLMHHPDKYGECYISSKNSIYSADDKEKVDEIIRLVEENS